MAIKYFICKFDDVADSNGEFVSSNLLKEVEITHDELESLTKEITNVDSTSAKIKIKEILKFTMKS